MTEVDLGAGALMGVGLASVAAAVMALLAVRRWSDQESIARAKAHAVAHLLEFRLFGDDPRQIFRSQQALIMDNLLIMRLLLRPFLILTLPMALAMWQLDAMYGRAPLPVGEPAVVSAKSKHRSIAVPEGVEVETKPMYVEATAQTSWRIRPSRATLGTVRVAAIERRLMAGSRMAYLPAPLLGRNGIEIAYPRATILGLHWLVWFVVLSTIAGLILRYPFRVRL
jgi:hypothetical protein